MAAILQTELTQPQPSPFFSPYQDSLPDCRNSGTEKP